MIGGRGWSWRHGRKRAPAPRCTGDAAGLGVLLGLLVAMSACGAEQDEGKDEGKDAGEDAVAESDVGGDGGGGGDSDDGTGGGDGAGEVDAAVEVPKENFWVVYGRRSRVPGSGDVNDLVLTDKDNPGAIDNAGTYGIGVSPLDGKSKGVQLTKYSFKNAGGLTCAYGCKLSQNLKYIAIADGQPSAGGTGYTYKLGTVNDQLQVFVGKFGELKDVADLHFADHKLYYSTPRNCFDTGKCQYEIRLRMMDGSAEEKVLTVMAPDNDADVTDTKPHTTYNGRFQVSEDGNTLTFLTTTIRSVKVWAWRGGNLYQLDYICEHPLDNNTCVGTGSQYHDNDEVGISPDGKTVVLFTIVDRSLRVRKYELGSTAAPVFSNLVTVPAGAEYKQSACFNIQSWQHAEVRSRPAFSSDGKIVYFLGYSECAGVDEKAWSDIFGLALDKIGGTIGKGDLMNFTENPRDNTVNNLWIRDFRLSPERKFFVFNASPLWGQSGEPASGKRMISDTEVYVLPIQLKATAVQITNEIAYHTDTPVAHLPVAIVK